jgi:hypothetical protein
MFPKSKKKMTQRHRQPSTASTTKEVNHTSYWHQPSQSSFSNKPSYQNFSSRQEYQSNYNWYPPSYYRPYNYTPHTNQIHTPQPTITYPLAPLQISYPIGSSQKTPPKVELSNPLHLHNRTKSLPSKLPISQPSEP